MDSNRHCQRYRARMQRVLAHIDAHLDTTLDAASLAALAGFSPFHFQRQFAALFGLAPGRYVQLQRLRRASLALAYRRAPVTDVALDAGYGAAEAFSRAFQRTLGQSPSGFRHRPDWTRWHAAFAPLDLQETSMAGYNDQLRVIDAPDIAVAVLEHRGDPRLLGDSLRRFIAWRRAHGLPPSRSRTFNVFHTPEDVDPEDFRMDLCAATGLPVATGAEGVVAGVLPGGRVAVVRHRGGDEALADVFRWLYAEWLPASGEVLREAPPYLERLSLHPDVPHHEAEWQAFLPLASR